MAPFISENRLCGSVYFPLVFNLVFTAVLWSVEPFFSAQTGGVINFDQFVRSPSPLLPFKIF